MPYTALYRKKRPRTFREVIGQPHIVRTLKNQLTYESISHAYLFCGTRGTGKTSTAKIFSRAINCKSPQEGDPCNVCEICQEILTERNLDVVEIDAASNNGVENIRDLREEVKYPPAGEAKYKVYIIDEVHMLSTSAFNALLKTLEEPPPHVIFILATTDPQKIPATILSRCQRYDFKRITMPDMVAAMKNYLQDTAVDEDAIQYIASLSDGAMRDALSILDQCLSFYNGETITLDKTRELLGAVDRQVLFDITDGLAASDVARVLTCIDGIIRDGRDVGQFIADFIKHCRDLMVASQTDGLDLLEYIDETRHAIKNQSSRLSLDTILRYIYTFSELQRDLRFAPHARTALEITAVKLCKPLAVEPVSIAESTEATPLLVVTQGKQTDTVPPKASANNNSLSAIEKGWSAFCKEIPMPMRIWLAGVEINNGVIQIICTNEVNLSLLKERQKELSERIMVKFLLETAPNLAFVVRDAYNKTDASWEAAADGAGSKSGQSAGSMVAESKQIESIAENDDWATLGDQVEMGPEWS